MLNGTMTLNQTEAIDCLLWDVDQIKYIGCSSRHPLISYLIDYNGLKFIALYCIRFPSIMNRYIRKCKYKETIYLSGERNIEIVL